MIREGWFTETLHRHHQQRLGVAELLFEEETDHQSLVIFENPQYGRVLALDGVVQLTERDEFIYHEMLAHVPILAHGEAREVLIVGGGDGGMARRCLMHDRLSRVTMVEIDETVVQLCRQWMPSVSAGAFEDPRLDLVIADGVDFVAQTDRRFDVIIIDSTDPIGPGEVLFSEDFYAACHRCLTPGGVLVTQNGVPWMQPGELRNSAARLAPHFADVGFYGCAVPTYAGGHMVLGWASDDPALRRHAPATIEARLPERVRNDSRYYTPGVHVGAFALPRFIEVLATA